MAETLSTLFVTEKNKLHSSSGWIVLFEAVIDASTSLRICDDEANFTWNGKTYYSFPMTVDLNRSQADGNLDYVTVTISNVSRELLTEVEALNFIDSRAWIRLAHRTSAALADVIEYQFQTQQIRQSMTEVRFQLGHIDLLNKQFPLNNFSRNRCRWVYKSANCGYTLALATCDLTLSGANGCTFHGDDEVANGQTRKHPNRFGGFPGIPKLHS